MRGGGYYSVTAHVEGGDQFRRTLKRAGVDMADLRAVNKRAAETVVPTAKALAPKETGLLTTTIRAGGAQRYGIIRAGKKAVPYAGPIHWGWPLHGIRPQPFLSTAAQIMEPVWTAQYMRWLSHLLAQVKGK